MSNTKIVVNHENITIRPSSIDTFTNCGYQWARVFLGGSVSIPNSRASIGTGIHASVEQLWTEAISAGSKDQINNAAAKDAGVETFQKEVQDYGMRYNEGEDENSCINEILVGTDAFIEDVVPFTDIPKAVEKRYSIDIDHDMVERVSGTIDYIGDHVIADVKTSKRKIAPGGYDVQQSIYKMLAEANGHDINSNLIQGVVLTKKPYGMILDLEPNVPKAKYLINNLLDTLDVLKEGKVNPEVLFRGNPKYYLCSEKFCAFYSDCPYVNGIDVDKKKAQVVKL